MHMLTGRCAGAVCIMEWIKDHECLAFILSVLVALSLTSDVQTIIQRSVVVNRRDWKAAPEYSYFERVQKDRGLTRTYHVLMIQGSPYEELVAVNGKPLSPEQQAAEQLKLGRVVERRRAESPQERAQRIAKYEKDRTRDRLMLEQLSEAFEFKLQGSQKLGRFDVYKLEATPRRGYRPPNAETQALTGMRGKLWIDQSTFQWVKVEARVVRPVYIEGFLAKVEPGTRFELEEAPVADGVWLPTHFAMKSRARILFVFSSGQQEDDSYFGYQKVTTGQLGSSRPVNSGSERTLVRTH